MKLLDFKTYLRFFIPVVGGACGGGAIASNYWIFLMPLSLSILWGGFEKNYSNFLWGFSFIFISHSWLFHLHPLTWLGFSWISSLIISLTIWICCSFLGGFLVLLWGAIGKKYIIKKCFLYKPSYQLLCKVLLQASLWAFGEQVLSQTSFFWIGVSESLIPGDLYLAGLSRWFGSIGVCLCQLMLGFWIFLIFEQWKRKMNFRNLIINGIFVITLLHIIGTLLILPNERNTLSPIAIWQTNLPTREKLLVNNSRLRKDFIIEQDKAVSNQANFLVAPEGILHEGFNLEFKSKIDTLIGGFRKDNGVLKSSLLAFNLGDTTYSDFIDKYRLVPIGEKIPEFIKSFATGLSAVGGIESGTQSRFFKWNNHPPLAVAICYEISDGLKIRDAIREGAQMIISIANLDPYPKKIQNQFLSIARMRSIENNKDTLLVANTGPSGLLTNNGRVDELASSNQKLQKILYANFNNRNTFYNKYGNAPIILFIFTLFAISVQKSK